MESNSSVTRFILSCNYSSKIIEPIQSRCAVFRFMPLLEADVHKMIDKVAKEEGLSLDAEAKNAVVYVSEGDMRKTLNVLQGASFHSKTIPSQLIYKINSRAKPKEVKDMVELAINGNFAKAREELDKLVINYGLSGEDILLQVYREIVNLEIPEDKKAVLIDRVGEYNFRLVEGANERIQIEAMLAQFVLLGKK